MCDVADSCGEVVGVADDCLGEGILRIAQFKSNLLPV